MCERRQREAQVMHYLLSKGVWKKSNFFLRAAVAPRKNQMSIHRICCGSRFLNCVCVCVEVLILSFDKFDIIEFCSSLLFIKLDRASEGRPIELTMKRGT